MRGWQGCGLTRGIEIRGILFRESAARSTVARQCASRCITEPDIMTQCVNACEAHSNLRRKLETSGRVPRTGYPQVVVAYDTVLRWRVEYDSMGQSYRQECQEMGRSDRLTCESLAVDSGSFIRIATASSKGK